MKHSIGTRDMVGKLETFIPLLQSQLKFSFQQTEKEDSKACDAVGPVYGGTCVQWSSDVTPNSIEWQEYGVETKT